MFGSLDPTFPLYPVCSCIGFVLSLIPLSWHIQAWNSGTCAFMVWTALACILYFINSLVWVSNVSNPTPVWCDISTKLIVGVSIGIPASILCISRRLYTLIAIQNAFVTRQDKRRMMIIDLLISVGIPAIVMALHYVVQPHRYDIYEGIGCYPVFYNTLPSYFLIFMWPTLLGFCSAIYSCFTLRSFWTRRIQFGQVMSSNASISMSQYFRLMLLALLDLVFTVPLSICITILGSKGVPMRPWVSWANTHFNFSRVVRVPAILWRNDPYMQLSLELTRWLPVFCAFLFFFLFGFASEARKHYLSLWKFIAGSFNLQSTNQTEVYLSRYLKPLKLASSSTLLPYGQPQAHCTLSDINSSSRSWRLGSPPPPIVAFESDRYSMDSASPAHLLEPGNLLMSKAVTTDAQLPIFPQLSHQDSRQTLPPCGSPPYRRPFCSPSICPVTTPDLPSRGLVAGVHVTIRTERSYEEF